MTTMIDENELKSTNTIADSNIPSGVLMEQTKYLPVSEYSSDIEEYQKHYCTELCVDASVTILHAITSKIAMNNKISLIKAYENQKLLELSAFDDREGIPIIIKLDENTTLEMLESAVKAITQPLLKYLREEKGININIEFKSLINSNVLVGILWNKGEI